MLDLGFIEDVEKILRMCPSGPPDGALLGDDAAADRAPRRGLHVRPGDDQGDAEAAHRRRDRAGLRRGRAKEKTERLIEVLQGRGARAGDHLLPHEDRRRAARRELRDRGLRIKALHGDMSQGQRDGVMIAFKDRGCRCWSPPTSPRAGSTSSTSPTSSTTTCRTTPRSTSTGSGAPGRVGRTGRAITFVTPAQRDEIAADRARGEDRDRRVGAARGAPRARAAAAPARPRPRARRTAAEPKPERRERRRRAGDGPREALRQPRRAQRDHRGRPALGADRGRGDPRGRDRRDPGARALLVRRARPPSTPSWRSSASTAPSSRASRSASSTRTASARLGWAQGRPAPPVPSRTRLPPVAGAKDDAER